MGDTIHKKTKRGYYEKQLTTDVIKDDGTKVRVTGLSKTSYEEACIDAQRKKDEVERLNKVNILKNKYSTTEPFKNYMLMYLEYKKNDVSTRKRWTSTTYETNFDIYKYKYKDSKVGNTQLKNLNTKLFQDFFDSLTLEKENDLSYVKNIRSLAIKTLEYINIHIIKIENYAKFADLNAVWMDEVPIDYDADVDTNSEQTLTEEEILKIYNCILDEPTRYRYAFAMLLQLGCGCRIQEVCAITTNCINFEEKYIIINKAIGRRRNKEGKRETYMKTTKNRVIRRVYMDETMEMCIRQLQKYMPRNLLKGHRVDYINKGLLIYNQKGDLVDSDSYTEEFKRLCYYCNITLQEGSGSKILRHTWDSYNNFNNNNPLQILITSKAAGHTPSVDVKSYTHVTEQMLRDNIKNPISQITKEKEEDEETYKEFLQFKKWKEMMEDKK